jgi:hypothetical protein
MLTSYFKGRAQLAKDWMPTKILLLGIEEKVFMFCLSKAPKNRRSTKEEVCHCFGQYFGKVLIAIELLRCQHQAKAQLTV